MKTMHISRSASTDVLPMYIDHTRFHATHPTHIKQWSTNTLRLLFVGRVEAEKSIDDIIRSMSPGDMSLVVIGIGSAQKHLLRLAASFGVDVRFVGQVANHQLAAWYSSSDIFVQSSATETLGFTTIEAMACGTCVVAKQAGANTEVVVHNHNGILYRNRSQLRRYLRTTTQRRRRLAHNGILWVGGRTVDASVSHLLRRYQRLLSTDIVD
jgi:1,2-diacylglycerol 3-alpha-glucosyltransferase